MLKNIISGSKTVEIYKIATAMKRGSVVTKDLTNKEAVAASAEGVQIYFVDNDYVPTGHLSDTEVSQYTVEADTIAAGTLGILVKAAQGTQWGTDQVVPTGLVAGDYAIAGTAGDAGKLIKAVNPNVSTLKYVGTYDDAGNTLYQFEVVAPFTVPL